MWIHYLLGRIFELQTDHVSLKYLFDQPSLNAGQARWLEFLSEFDFEVNHVKEKENKVVDALSRKFHVATMRLCKTNLRDQFKKVSVEDEKCIQVVGELRQGEPNQKYEGYKLE